MGWVPDFAADIVGTHFMKRKGKREEKNGSEVTNPSVYRKTQKEHHWRRQCQESSHTSCRVTQKEWSGLAGPSIFKQLTPTSVPWKKNSSQSLLKLVPGWPPARGRGHQDQAVLGQPSSNVSCSKDFISQEISTGTRVQYPEMLKSQKA